MSDLALLANELATNDSFLDKLVINAKFHPRIQLFSSKSREVEVGNIPVNHWGISAGKDKFDSLGETFVALPVAVRPFAMDLSGKKPASYYDTKSEGFIKCYENCNFKDSKMMAGVQFLLLLPDNKYATYFCASKSAKVVADQLMKLLFRFIEFSSYTVVTDSWAYRAPKISLSDIQFDLPDPDSIRAAVKEFKQVEAEIPEAR